MKTFILTLSIGVLPLSFASSSEIPDAIPGEYIVKMKKGFSPKKVFNDRMKIVGELKLGNRIYARVRGNSNVLKKFEQIEYFEPNYRVKEDVIASDKLAKQQWAIENTGKNEPYSYYKTMGIPGIDLSLGSAWKDTDGDQSIIIAIVDTGVDYNHPDLKDNIWVNTLEASGVDGVDDDGNGIIDDIHGATYLTDFEKGDIVENGDPMDDRGHGTHVAGIIGAIHNKLGVAGTMNRVSIMPVKFLGKDGGSTFDGMLAIKYAIEAGARVINNSWGGGGYSKSLEDAIKFAAAKDIVFVAAAGNDGTDNGIFKHYPSDYQVENVIAVAAHHSGNGLAPFSNYGKTVHIAAPGQGIYSTYPGNSYRSLSGTSMATPYVSGAVGLLLSVEPQLSAVEVKKRVMETSVKSLAYLGRVESNGRLNIERLLNNDITSSKIASKNSWKKFKLADVSKERSISIDKPYKDSTKVIYKLQLDKPSSVKFIFDYFDTELVHDYLEIRSETDGIVYSGDLGKDFQTSELYGQNFEFWFHSDAPDSVGDNSHKGFTIREIKIAQ
ncbi:MAG: S8 family serine peptidase [Halobacteriovoraceae bacterium]|nr:S8 family serine peptidase [Halobacteriovoraceae bacterium]MCB9095194.1 S8 family serine peptidase [Halobacteriovoraceae bacterium]